MNIAELKEKLIRHVGVFYCEPRGGGNEVKEVDFKHIVTDPVSVIRIPDIKTLQDFYGTFGSLRLYADELSGDSAFYLAKTSEWSDLHEHYSGWLEIFDDEDPEDLEDDDMIPDWVNNCLVFGEIPHSGNYLLMPLAGIKTGYVFEFEHDGFEFIEHAPNIESFLQQVIKPTESMLTDMASHMVFADENSDVQWWITEMKDNFGHTMKSEQ